MRPKIPFIFVFILIFTILSTSQAQISIPEKSSRDTIIEATVTTEMPEGAEFYGDWEAPGVSFKEAGPHKLHIAGKPGEYVLMYQGYWLHFGSPITVKDINGVEQTFKPLLGHGKIKDKTSYKITETPDPPDPTPDPGPNPGSPKQIVIFIKADDLDKPTITPGQRELATSLKIHQDLHDLGYEIIQVIDDNQIKEGVPSRWAPWVKRVMGQQLPVMAYANISGGKITVVPLPDGFDAAVKILGGDK